MFPEYAQIDLAENVEAFSLFPMGYPAEKHSQQDRFDESRISKYVKRGS